jgi:malate synthase
VRSLASGSKAVTLTVGMGADTATAWSGEVVAFVADLQRQFGAARTEVLRRRKQRHVDIAGGEWLDFLWETGRCARRRGVWPHLLTLSIAGWRSPALLPPRWIINAMNSGARVFMANFDAARL